jgi:hypothetical protein
LANQKQKFFIKETLPMKVLLGRCGTSTKARGQLMVVDWIGIGYWTWTNLNVILIYMEL